MSRIIWIIGSLIWTKTQKKGHITVALFLYNQMLIYFLTPVSALPAVAGVLTGTPVKPFCNSFAFR
jgi:hypothetical protein